MHPRYYRPRASHHHHHTTTTTTTSRIVISFGARTEWISFQPSSRHTTRASLREAIVSVFDLHPDDSIVLRDNDGCVVPLDKSLATLHPNTVLILHVRSSSSSSSTDHHESRLAKLLSITSWTVDENWNVAFQSIVRQTRLVVDADEASLYLVSRDNTSLIRFFHSSAMTDNDVEESDIPVPTHATTTTFTTAPHPPPQDEGEMPSVPFDESSIVGAAACTGKTQHSDMNHISTRALPIFDLDKKPTAVLLVSKQNNLTDEDEQGLEYCKTVTGSLLHRFRLFDDSSIANYRANYAMERAERILSVTKDLATADKPREIFVLMEKFAYELLNAERLTIFSVRHDSDELEIVRSRDTSVVGRRISVKNGVAGYVARSAKEINIEDAQTHELFDSSIDNTTGFRTRTILCCPIKDASKRVIGVVQALNRKSPTGGAMLGIRRSSLGSMVGTGGGGTGGGVGGGDETSSVASQNTSPQEDHQVMAFTDDDVHLLMVLCSSVGMMLSKSKALEDAQRTAMLNRSLLNVSRAVAQASGLTKIISIVVKSLERLLGADRVAMLFADEGEEEFLCLYYEPRTGIEKFTRIPMNPTGSVEGMVSTTGKLINVKDVSKCTFFSRALDIKTACHSKTVICAPFQLGARVEGGARHIVLAVNKRESESSLARAAAAVAGNAMDPNEGRFVPFEEEDEAALLSFCDEVEVATKSKRIEVDVKNILVGSSSKMDESDQLLVDMYRKKEHNSGDHIPTSPTRRGSKMSQLFGSGGVMGASSTTLGTNTVPWASMLNSFSISNTSSGGTNDGETSPMHTSTGGVDVGATTTTTTTTELSSEVTIRAAETVRKIDWRTMDFLKQSIPTLCSWTEAILLSDLALLRRCRVATNKLSQFVIQVKDNYRQENPFHNFYHAFSVAHTAWTMLQCEAPSKLLDSSERLAVLLAALCHDLQHPGNTNALELNTLSPLALTYTDEAVLEKHHCYIAFQLLYRDPKCNILGNLRPDSEELQAIRKTIINCIMATDMRHHVEHVAELQRRIDSKRAKSVVLDDMSVEPTLMNSTRSRAASMLASGVKLDPAAAAASTAGGGAASGGGGGGDLPIEHRRSTSSSALYVFNTPRHVVAESKTAEDQFMPVSGETTHNTRAIDAFDEEDEAGMMLLCGTIVHAADLSSQTLPFDLATPWGWRIAEEFILQGEKEKAAGLKVTTPIWKDDKSFYGGQSFFCRTFVIPLWRAVVAVMPELSVRVELLEGNNKRYLELVAELNGTGSKPTSPKLTAVAVAPTATATTNGSSSSSNKEVV